LDSTYVSKKILIIRGIFGSMDNTPQRAFVLVQWTRLFQGIVVLVVLGAMGCDFSSYIIPPMS